MPAQHRHQNTEELWACVGVKMWLSFLVAKVTKETWSIPPSRLCLLTATMPGRWMRAAGHSVPCGQPDLLLSAAGVRAHPSCQWPAGGAPDTFRRAWVPGSFQSRLHSQVPVAWVPPLRQSSLAPVGVMQVYRAGDIHRHSHLSQNEVSSLACSTRQSPPSQGPWA